MTIERIEKEIGELENWIGKNARVFGKPMKGFTPEAIEEIKNAIRYKSGLIEQLEKKLRIAKCTQIKYLENWIKFNIIELHKRTLNPTAVKEIQDAMIIKSNLIKKLRNEVDMMDEYLKNCKELCDHMNKKDKYLEAWKEFQKDNEDKYLECRRDWDELLN